MADIEITQRTGSFEVTVNDGSGETTHHVSVPDGYLAKLGLDDVDRTELVRRSFEFLLEREPKESIMRTFELSVIQRYFPEYPDEIRQQMSGSSGAP